MLHLLKDLLYFDHVIYSDKVTLIYPTFPFCLFVFFNFPPPLSESISLYKAHALCKRFTAAIVASFLWVEYRRGDRNGFCLLSPHRSVLRCCCSASVVLYIALINVLQVLLPAFKPRVKCLSVSVSVHPSFLFLVVEHLSLLNPHQHQHHRRPAGGGPTGTGCFTAPGVTWHMVVACCLRHETLMHTRVSGCSETHRTKPCLAIWGVVEEYIGGGTCTMMYDPHDRVQYNDYTILYHILYHTILDHGLYYNPWYIL